MNNNFKEEILTDKEIHFVKQIISKYDLNICKAYKVKSIYKLYSKDNKCYCLKGIYRNKNKIINASNLIEVLYKNNFYNTPMYYKDRKGNLFNIYHKSLFYITDWIEGNEVNLSSLHEAKLTSELLAQFHSKSKVMDSRYLKLRNTTNKNISSQFMDNIYLLNKFESIIQNKRLKNSFDYEYNQYISVFVNQALIALNILNTCAYANILKNPDSTVICHNKFNSRSVIKNKEGVFLVNLNYLSYDLRINDLGKYIRRVMIRGSYKWDFIKCRDMIESYNKNYKLSKDELLLMLAIVIFPYKFCKLGKKRYIKNKNWSESKYNDKLKRVIKQYKINSDFISDYLKYVNDYE